jgi:hypothetical protein
MPSLQDPISAVLRQWRTRLNEKENKDFESTSLDDLKCFITQIQDRLEATKDGRNMNRLSKFLEGMEQFGKVIEVFANSSVYVAFIWGPIKLILQVSKLLLLYALPVHCNGPIWLHSLSHLTNRNRLQVTMLTCWTFCWTLIRILESISHC